MNKIYFYSGSLQFPDSWDVMPKGSDFCALSADRGIEECKVVLESCNRDILTNSPLALLDRYALVKDKNNPMNPICRVMILTGSGWILAQELTNVRIGITSDLLTLYLDKALRGMCL